MLLALLNLGPVMLGTQAYRPENNLGTSFRGILATGWRTGHRLAEFVAHPSGELCYMARADVSYVLAGVSIEDPTPAQIANARPGDVILLRPPRSKTDQFGEIHCPFPSSLPISNDVNSPGYIILSIERARPCRGAARTDTPLFADDHDSHMQ